MIHPLRIPFAEPVAHTLFLAGGVVEDIGRRESGLNMKHYSFIFVLMLCILLVVGCNPKGEQIEPEEYTVALGSIREAVICDGTIEPLTSVEIKSKASGILEFRGFVEGDVVHAGDLMYRLDKSLIQQSVTRARASLKIARAQLELAKRDQTRDERAQLENTIEQVRIDVADAEDRYERIKELYSREYATQQELDDAEAALERAKLRLDLALKRLEESDAGGEKENIDVAQARVTLADADLKNALEELSETEIIAPFTGVLISQDVEVGDTITSATRGAASGSVLGVLADLSHVYLRGYVDESDIGRVSVGMQAEVNVNSYPGISIPGNLARIFPKAEDMQGVTTFKVDIELSGGGFVTKQMAAIGIGDGKADGDNDNVSAGVDGKDEDEAEAADESDASVEEDASEDAENSASDNSPDGMPGHGAFGKGMGKGKGNWNVGSREGPVEIRVGMTADAQIIIRDIPETIVIPMTFVDFRAKPPEVNLKNPETGEFAPHQIKVGFTDGVNIVVEDGLDVGDVIVRVPRAAKPPLRK